MKRYSILAIPLLFLAGCGSREEKPADPVVDVKVARAETADVKLTVRAPASVFAREQANISARITAPIRKLLVRKGDNVAAGQALAQLDNRDLAAQRDEAAAAVADAEANLQKVESGTRPTDIERARGQAVGTEAALNQAQKFYERRKQLFEQGAIPQRDLQLSQTELAQAKANFEVARRSLDLLQNQSRDKEIQMARSGGAGAGAVDAGPGAMDFSEIRSPFSGTISEQFMFSGAMAKPMLDLSVMTLRGGCSRAGAGKEAAADARGRRVLFYASGQRRRFLSGPLTWLTKPSIRPADRGGLGARFPMASTDCAADCSGGRSVRRCRAGKRRHPCGCAQFIEGATNRRW
jgi:multidrug efflux pump subunit AcrA (membrane-fusion protein)